MKKLVVYVIGMIMLLGIWRLPVFSLQVQASSEIELLQIAIAHLKEDVNEHIQNCEASVGISKIEKTATEGNKDTYTITMTDNTTYDFIITNGLDGKDGVDGKDGINGKDAEPVTSEIITKNDNGSLEGKIAMVIASISLMGNIMMSVLMLKNRKSEKS